MIPRCRRLAAALLNEEAGQDLVEYALVAVIVAMGSVSAMSTLAISISTVFSNLSGTLNGAL